METTNEVVFDRKYDASPQKVWQVWTNPEMIS